jgi:hypothetical protein
MLIVVDEFNVAATIAARLHDHPAVIASAVRVFNHTADMHLERTGTVGVIIRLSVTAELKHQFATLTTQSHRIRNRFSRWAIVYIPALHRLLGIFGHPTNLLKYGSGMVPEHTVARLTGHSPPIRTGIKHILT